MLFFGAIEWVLVVLVIVGATYLHRLRWYAEKLALTQSVMQARADDELVPNGIAARDYRWSRVGFAMAAIMALTTAASMSTDRWFAGLATILCFITFLVMYVSIERECREADNRRLAKLHNVTPIRVHL